MAKRIQLPDDYDVDPNALDVECACQSKYMEEACRQLADAKHVLAVAESALEVAKAEAAQALALAKHRLEVTSAEALLAIHKNPGLVGLEKIQNAGQAEAGVATNRRVRAAAQAVIKANVVLNAAVRTADVELIAAKHLVDEHAAQVSRYTHRKGMIEAEVELARQGYFSLPWAPPDGPVASNARDRAFSPKKKRQQA